jgi:phospholipase A1/A2
MQPCSRPLTPKHSRWFAAGALFLALSAQAAEPDPLSRCTAIPDREQRWRCYDEVTAITDSGNSNDGPAEDTCGAGYTALSRQWNTRPNCESKLYHLVPYKQNYLIARYSYNPNNQPNSANFGLARDQETDHTELKFQLSLKVKVAEQIGNLADLWFAYTEQSSWQAFNSSNARPFRDTDYEPELILAFPLRTQLSALGLVPRTINLGLVHQSTGRAEPFERSWDRAYVQIGLDRDVDKEHDRFAVLARAWYRVPESPSEDDNPDIQHYLGYGDLLIFWRRGDSNVSALLRNNLQTKNNRGSLQLNWSIPITRAPSLDNVNVLHLIERELRFYVQFFSGYGETLIDYNHYQTTIGIGIMLTDWM